MSRLATTFTIFVGAIQRLRDALRIKVDKSDHLSALITKN